jgi:hypothetical protein
MRSPFAVVLGAVVVVATLNAQTVRDSAGIQIVENSRPSSTIRVGASPLVVIGNQPGEPYLLSRVAGAARLADGRIVIANGSTFQLRYFDASGKHLRSVGQRGSGPGDFESLDVFARLPGDTLMAGSTMRRQSYFTASGAFVRDAPPPTGTNLPPGPKLIMGVFADHSIVAIAPNLRPQANGRAQWIEPGTVFAVDRAARATPFGSFPMMEMVATNGEPGTAWFAPTAAFAVGATHLFVGFGNAYTINVVNRDGKLVRIIRRAWTPRRVTTADIDKYVAAWSELWIKPDSPTAARERQELRDSKYAATLPAFSEFRVDSRGRLWVREPNLDDAPSCGCLNEGAWGVSTWSIFDASGRWVSDVRMPARFRPYDIGADYILGVQRDDDDVPLVAMYRLIG